MSSPAYGNNTDIQFNDSGYANGSDSFTFNKNNLTATVANTLISGNQSVSVGAAGVVGYSYSGFGVQGQSNTGTGGYFTSNSGTGLCGYAPNSTAIYGLSGSGYAVQGVSNTNNGGYFQSNSGTGVISYSNSSVGVTGQSNTLYGVQGLSNTSYGVLGSSTTGVGVQGISNPNIAVSGISNTNTGVAGTSNSGYGIQGYSNTNVGGYFSSCTNIGVEGISINNYPGVQGTSNNNSGVGGFSTYGSGVFGQSNSWYGVYGNSNAGTAGFFNSNTGIGLSVQSNTNTIVQYSNATGVVASMDNYGTRYKNGATITPWVNVVTDFGASPSASAATNTTAFNNAITYACNNGYNIFIPPGTYYVNSLTTVTQPIQIMGAGKNQTFISMCATTGDIFDINAYDVEISHIYFFSNCFRTSGYDINFNNASLSSVHDCQFVGSYRAIGVISSGNTNIYNIIIHYILGDCGIYYGGTSTDNTYGAWLSHAVITAEYNGSIGGPSLPAEIVSWSNSKAYTPTQTFINNGWIWECITAGTSQSSGNISLPSHSFSNPFYNQTVTSGTATFQLIMKSGVSAVWMDSYSNSLSTRCTQFLGIYRGFYMTDSANTGTSYPNWPYFVDCSCDHNFQVGIDVEAGLGFNCIGSWFGSQYQGNAVQFGGTYVGETRMQSCRIAYPAQNGILINTGVEHIISDCMVGGCGKGGSQGQYNGIVVGSNVQRFSINGNRTGLLASDGSTLDYQGYGIYVVSGDSDYYSIYNNVGYKNYYGSVSDNGTGSHKLVNNV